MSSEASGSPSPLARQRTKQLAKAGTGAFGGVLERKKTDRRRAGLDEEPKEKELERQETQPAEEKKDLRSKEAQDLLQVFRYADRDDGGSISRQELRELLEVIGLHVSSGEFDRIVQDMDEDGSGEIEFSEFLEVMMRKVSMDCGCERVIEAFKYFEDRYDPNHEPGTVQASTLVEELSEFVDNLNDKQLAEFSAEVGIGDVKASIAELPGTIYDLDLNDGKFHYEDYVRVMMHQEREAEDEEDKGASFGTIHGATKPEDEDEMSPAGDLPTAEAEKEALRLLMGKKPPRDRNEVAKERALALVQLKRNRLLDAKAQILVDGSNAIAEAQQQDQPRGSVSGRKSLHGRASVFQGRASISAGRASVVGRASVLQAQGAIRGRPSIRGSIANRPKARQSVRMRQSVVVITEETGERAATAHEKVQQLLDQQKRAQPRKSLRPLPPTARGARASMVKHAMSGLLDG